ncbi:MAG TPA: class IV adenylate cyclase [Terriglobales bacterium]|jgi:adenylate cyclase class 2
MLRPANEVEIKFRVHDLAELNRRLRRVRFRRVTPPTHELNTLYDLPGQPLRRGGQLLRLRRYGKKWLLTHKAKGKPGRHKARVETELEISDGGKMESILFALGFRPSFRYEKFRAEWTDGTGHVVVDETPVGNFAEIEGTPAWIDRTAKALGVSRAQYITENYASLFFAWKRRSRSPAKEMTFTAIARP